MNDAVAPELLAINPDLMVVNTGEGLWFIARNSETMHPEGVGAGVALYPIRPPNPAHEHADTRTQDHGDLPLRYQ